MQTVLQSFTAAGSDAKCSDKPAMSCTARWKAAIPSASASRPSNSRVTSSAYDPSRDSTSMSSAPSSPPSAPQCLDDTNTGAPPSGHLTYSKMASITTRNRSGPARSPALHPALFRTSYQRVPTRNLNVAFLCRSRTTATKRGGSPRTSSALKRCLRPTLSKAAMTSQNAAHVVWPARLRRLSSSTMFQQQSVTPLPGRKPQADSGSLSASHARKRAAMTPDTSDPIASRTAMVRHDAGAVASPPFLGSAASFAKSNSV